MRTRDEIWDSALRHEIGLSNTLVLEVLLDIREMLMPLTNPLVEVTDEKEDGSLPGFHCPYEQCQRYILNPIPGKTNFCGYCGGDITQSMKKLEEHNAR